MLKRFFSWFNSLFGRKKLALGFYGSVNVGKSTLANRFFSDWNGGQQSIVSDIPHETRVIQREKITARVKGKKLLLDVLDMPGLATKIDYREFEKHGINKEEAQQRAKEATKGVVEAIKALDEVDAALVVMDSTKDPLTQVNLSLMGNLEARGIPIIIVANKLDSDKARVDRIAEAFPNHVVLGVSALTGENIPKLYETIANKL